MKISIIAIVLFLGGASALRQKKEKETNQRKLEGEPPMAPFTEERQAQAQDLAEDLAEAQTNGESEASYCTIASEAAQGVCDRPNSFKFIVNSCGDVYGPTVIDRAMAASGHDLTNNFTKAHYSEAWEYMASLSPDAVFLTGDNVYNDGIANWGKDYHPFGTNIANVLSDASEPFLKYHGYLNDDGTAGPLFYSYLELLKDKLNDGYFANDEFAALRELTKNSIHASWDDHDYLTNDPSNPHYLRHLFRKASIDKLTGWDRNYFRFGPSHKGIERTWTKELVDNNGNPFLVRFIILDEETTHNNAQGCAYYYDPSSPTGFTPRQAEDSTASCPNIDIIEDFENDDTERVYYGDDQLNWFREQLMKPSDLIFVVTGGPNFELEYPYASLTEYPSEKRKFVQILRETGVEHLIFMTGDSHATYLTKAPGYTGYPLYTIVGSGLTSGFSYDRYVSYYGDVSHRFLVAAGSNAKNIAAATFAEVQVMFDDDGAFVRFIPHLKDGNGPGNDQGWTGQWYAKTEPNAEEPWTAEFDIRVSELEIPADWPRYHYDSSIPHKFIPEDLLIKFNASSTAEVAVGRQGGPTVTLTITNASGEKESFELAEGSNCGAGFYGFCKDKWGAFSYNALKVGDYVHSKELQKICEHAGFVGDEIQWSVEEDGEVKEGGSLTLRIRNNALFNSAGETVELEYYGSTEAYTPVRGESIGIPVTTIIDAPEMYGGFKVPVKGFDFETGEFDDPAVQEAYAAFLAAPEPEVEGESKDTTELMAIYLSTYYPDLPQL